MNSQQFSILSNLPVSKLRYYEKKGLIPEKYVSRDHNGYRIYSEKLLYHLKDITILLSSGFTIAELKTVLQDANSITPEDKFKKIKEKIEEIEVKKKELEYSQELLTKLLNNQKVISESENWNCS